MAEDDKATATVNGIPLIASKPITWEIRAGTQPVVQEFPVRPVNVPALLNARQNIVTLRITGRGEVFQFQRLINLGIFPGPNKDVRHLRLADRRWLWKYIHVLRRYNIHRKVGVRRPVDVRNDLAVDVNPDVQYAPWSLRDERGTSVKWKLEEILEDVFEGTIAEREDEVPRWGGELLPLLGNIPAQVNEIPIENLEIDDTADAAIARIISHVPGLALFIDRNGQVVFYDRASGVEELLLFNRREIVDRGHAAVVNTKFTRPREVRVHFTIESEFRCDYREREIDAGATPQGVQAEAFRESARLLDNVVQIPDFTLLSEGTTYVTGTYLEIEKYLAAIGNPPAGAPPLDLERMLRASSPFVDMTAGLIPPHTENPGLWSVRIAAIQNAYRRLFRIPPELMARFLSVRAYRVATIDPVVGTRSPACAWFDHTIVRAAPILGDGGGVNGPQAEYGQTVRGYPQNGDPIDNFFTQLKALDEDVSMPARINVVDEDQGILLLDLIPDTQYYFPSSLPGFLKDGTNPKRNIRQAGIQARSHPVFFNAMASGGMLPQFEKGWKMATIFTAIPASPNSEAQLFTITIPHDHAGLQDVLPPQAQAGANDALGPAMDVRVPSNVETARVMWRDDLAKLILEEVFGLDAPRFPNAPNGKTIRDLIVNLSERPEGSRIVPSRLLNQLEAIAIAEAAIVYSENVSRLQGASEVDATQAPLILRGNMESVVITLGVNGELTARIELPDQIPGVSIFRFLDDGLRRMLMRSAQGPAAR